MPSDIVGANRSNALWRLLGLLYLFTVWPIVAAGAFIVGLLFMIVDVVVQLIFNSPGWTGRWMDATKRVYSWPLDQAKWILLGAGQFRFTP